MPSLGFVGRSVWVRRGGLRCCWTGDSAAATVKPFLSCVLLLGAVLHTAAQTTVGGAQSDYCIEWIQQGGGHINRVTPSVRLQENGADRRGLEELRRCGSDKMVVGCIVSATTGNIYITDPDVCASASTAALSGNQCRDEIAIYGYTSNALPGADPPAGWYDITCPILVTDCDAETEIYCPSSSTCLADCSSCSEYVWDPLDGIAAADDVCTSDGPEPEPELLPPPPPPMEAPKSYLWVVLLFGGVLLLLGFGFCGWKFHKSRLLAVKIKVPKSSDIDPLSVVIQEVSKPIVSAQSGAEQEENQPEQTQTQSQPGEAEPKSEARPDQQILTPKQRRELAKEQARRRWEDQEAEERRQLMEMLSAKFTFAKINDNQTEAEMLGLARCVFCC